MILCDTGPLVAAFNIADRDHGRCAEFLLADDRGLFEHTLRAVPRREHGYCVDDVARGLGLGVLTLPGVPALGCRISELE